MDIFCYPFLEAGGEPEFRLLLSEPLLLEPAGIVNKLF
jgi:hypothetical protein